MALYYDLPVFKEVYQLILKIFEYTKDFPKEYKYTLGQEMFIVAKRHYAIYTNRSTQARTKTQEMLVLIKECPF